jgi:hypothetical protein
MKYPVKLVPNIPVQLSAHQPFFRREHVVILRVTGTGGIEKPNSALIHKISIYEGGEK